MRILGRQRLILGITAIAAVADIVDVGELVVVAVVDGEVDHHPLADAAGGNPVADGDDPADRVGALDAREGQRVALRSPRVETAAASSSVP